ncbi:MAG: leucine-rich repeat domain-containing protein [Bacteroidaceae bacterium]|nr:leucine-rich repeat domain-containing protein [Bacteroidaceae bacterium]
MKIRFLLSALLALSSINSFAVEVLDTVSVGGIRYVISATDIPSCKVVYSPEGYSGAVVIPERVSVDGTQYEVVSIAQGAFAFCKDLTSVQLPTTLRSVGKSAFAYCDNLSCLEIPEGVTYIDEYAFEGNHKLHTLILPSTLKAIHCTAINNYSLSSVYLKSTTPPDVIAKDGGYMQYNHMMFNLNELSYTECNLYVPENSVALYSYYDGNESGKTWQRAEHIYPFDYGSDIISPSQPADSILFKIRCRNTTTIFSDYYGDDKDNLNAVCIDGIYYVVTSLTDRTCKVVAGDYYYHGDVVIPAHVNIDGADYRVNEISKNAFRNCYLLTSLSLPETIEKIGSFRNCASLTAVSVPEAAAIKSDIEETFVRCNSLKMVTWGNELIKLDYYGVSLDDPYFHCVVNHDAEYKPDPSKYALYLDNIYYAIENGHAVVCCTDNVSRLIIPDEITVDGAVYPVKVIRNGAFGNDLLYVSIPSSVTDIDINSSYYGCSLNQIDMAQGCGLTGLEFVGCFSLAAGEDNIVYVGRSALKLLDKNSSVPVRIKKGTEYVAPDAFKNTAITDIYFPESLISIGNNAFSGCSGIKSVIFPEGLKEIGKYAFAGCSNLESIEIPKGVQTAFLNSFSGCTGIRSITYPSGCQVVDAAPFFISNLDGCTWDIVWEDHFIQTDRERVYYEGGLDLHTMVSDDLYNRAESFTARFADNVSVILGFFNDGRRLENMTGLVLGSGVTSVENFAFWKSDRLKEIEINSAPSIGAYAFGASDLIEKITITSAVPPRIADLSKYCEPVMQAEDVYAGSLGFLADSIVNTEQAMYGRSLVLYGDKGVTDQWQADFDVEYETPGKYDVYVVVLPNGLLPEFTKTKPNQFNCFLNSLDKDGNIVQFTQKDPDRPTRNYKYVNDKQKADTILVGQIELFDNMPYGQENKLTVSIKINMTASETKTYSNTMLLDAIILDQKEQAATVEDMDKSKQRSVFSESVYSNALLQVPAGSIDAYRNAPCWGLFSNIVEAEGSADPEGLDFFCGFENMEVCRVETVTKDIRWNVKSDIVQTETDGDNTYLVWKTAGINNDYDCGLTDAVLKVGSFNLKAGVSYFVKYSVMSDCWTGNLQVDVVRRSDDMVLGHMSSLTSFSEDWEQYRGSFRIGYDCDDCYVRFSFLSPGQTFSIDDISVSDKYDVEAVCNNDLIRLYFSSDLVMPQLPVDPVGIYEIDPACFEVTGVNPSTNVRERIDLNYAEFIHSDNSIYLFSETEMEQYEDLRVSFINLPSDNGLCIKYVSFIDPESKEKSYKPLHDFHDLAVRMDFSVSHGPDLRYSDPAPYSFENPTDTRIVTLHFSSHENLTSTDGISARMLFPGGKAEYWKVSGFDAVTQTLVMERPSDQIAPLFGAATFVVDGLPFMCSVPMSFGVKGQVPDRQMTASSDSAYTYRFGERIDLDINRTQVMLYYRRSPEVLDKLREDYGITPVKGSYIHLGTYEGELVMNGRFYLNDAQFEQTLSALRVDPSVIDVERVIDSHYPVGLYDQFQVVLKDRSYESALEKELEYTGTRIKSHTYGRLTYYIQADRNSVADVIDCANMFYESGICSSISLMTEGREHFSDEKYYWGIPTYSKYYIGDEKFTKKNDEQTIVIYYEDPDDDANNKTRGGVTDETVLEFLSRVYGVTVSDEYEMDSIAYMRADSTLIRALPFKIPEGVVIAPGVIEEVNVDNLVSRLMQEQLVDDVERTMMIGDELKAVTNTFLVEVVDSSDTASFNILLEETGTALVGFDSETGLFELRSNKSSSGNALKCLNTFFESGFCLNVYPIFATLTRNDGPVSIDSIATQPGQKLIIHDLNGRRVSEPETPGIYIFTRVADGKVIESRRVMITE